MVPVLLAVAIVGYLLGASRPSTGPRAPSTVLVARTAAVSDPVVLEYPSPPSWPLASGAPRLPGLAIAQSLVLAPDGDAHEAGLIAGQIPAESSSPLPAAFLAHLREVPRAEVVSLLNTQAYRYGRLTPTGSDYQITLYAVPGVTGNIVTIACYSVVSPKASSYLKMCEGLAEELTLQVEGESEILPPNAGYARQVGEVLARVDKRRLGLRPAMSRQTSPATQVDAALQLADAFGEASRSLAAIQAPAATGWAQAAVSQGLSEADEAYVSLAAAVRADRMSNYKMARLHVYGVEASIAAALKRYALMGYE
jgi:hypothetical protein